eukprot:superscaffoldBa00004424_g18861
MTSRSRRTGEIPEELWVGGGGLGGAGRALFRKQLFCPGSLLSPLLGAMDVMVRGVNIPGIPPPPPTPPAATSLPPLPDAKLRDDGGNPTGRRLISSRKRPTIPQTQHRPAGGSEVRGQRSAALQALRTDLQKKKKKKDKQFERFFKLLT